MQLVRRFFLADTGLATAVGAAPAALQYVQSAQLVVTSQAGVHSAIYPPLLKLQYATVALGSSVEATSSFQVGVGGVGWLFSEQVLISHKPGGPRMLLSRMVHGHER